MEAVEVCNQEGVLFVGVVVDVALMPHACHLTDTLITRLYSWERPYSHSQSGYIPFFLLLDCLTFFSPCLTLFQLFHRVGSLRWSCVMSLALRTDLQVELLTAL